MDNGSETVQRTSSSFSEVVNTIDLSPTISDESHVVALRSCPNNSARSEDARQPESSDQFEGRLATSQVNLRSPRTDMLMLTGLVNSTTMQHHESFILKSSFEQSGGHMPPSYSTVLKLGPAVSHFPSSTYPSIPFITRQPPPSYAEIHGRESDNLSMISADSFSLGPNPLYVSCPHCRVIVVSTIYTERSTLSYILSVVLCMCLCWPCCLVPFCLKSCRNTHHFCPRCHYYLGVYRPLNIISHYPSYLYNPSNSISRASTPEPSSVAAPP
ncbi:uncharacterized protein [Euwallacea similis]|uniref:uncharacterized protein n=1 Tax=Euwallacea similis TaxID=1736056 RepID=UPI00344C05E1